MRRPSARRNAPTPPCPSIARSANAADEVAACHTTSRLFAGMLVALIRVMQQRTRLVDRAHPSRAAISLPKVSIALNSDHTQPLVVRVFSWWQEWSANINPIENSVLFARPPSICSIFDTLWQQRIMAAFGARRKYCCFSNPRSAVASASSNIHLA